MPPTTPITLIQPTLPQKQKLALLARNYNLGDSSSEDVQAGPTTTISDSEFSTYIPYGPPPSLHASLVAVAETPEPTISAPSSRSTTQSHYNSAAIAIAFSIGFVSLVCGLSVIMLARWFKLRDTFIGVQKIFQRRFWHRRFSKPGGTAPTLGEEPVVVIGVEYAGGDAFVHSITLDQDLDKQSTTSDLGQSGQPRIPPSVISAESLTLRPDYSTPSMTCFQQRLDAEEADISMAIGIAMRDCTYSGSELSTINQSPKLNASDHDSWDLKYRTRQNSNASDSTQPTTESQVFSISATLRSSLTSIPEMARDSEFDTEELMDMEMINDTEDMVFEVARAQAQSMEIKRGVLFNWTSQRTSLSPVPEETILLTPSSSDRPSIPTVPSLMVTCPSMMTIPLIGPSFSSISVDLNEFPLPPSAFNYEKSFDEFDIHFPVIPDFDSRTGACSRYW